MLLVQIKTQQRPTFVPQQQMISTSQYPQQQALPQTETIMVQHPSYPISAVSSATMQPQVFYNNTQPQSYPQPYNPNYINATAPVDDDEGNLTVYS